MNAFLNDIGTSPFLSEPVDIARAASSVLCNLFRHVSAGEVEQFFSELPVALRGLIQCERTSDQAERFGRDEFIGRVSRELGISITGAENVCRAVLQAVRGYVPAREINDVQSQLPPGLIELFGPPTSSAA